MRACVVSALQDRVTGGIVDRGHVLPLAQRGREDGDQVIVEGNGIASALDVRTDIGGGPSCRFVRDGCVCDVKLVL